MPKRRYVSENAIFSKSINKISVGAEATFYRLLSISDDFGVVPNDEEELLGMINYRGEREKHFSEYISELKDSKLLVYFEYDKRSFLMFNPDTFDKYQDHIGYKRTRSEHSGIKAKSREEFDLRRSSNKISENPRNVFPDDAPKEERLKTKVFNLSSLHTHTNGKPENMEQVISLFEKYKFGDKSEAIRFFNHYQITGWKTSAGIRSENWMALASEWKPSRKK